jgi:molybdenum cofactor synthesis domain-containing protein
MVGRVVSVNLSKEKGTVKQPVSSVQLNEFGIVGDAHAGSWHRQISLLSKEQIDVFVRQTGMRIQSGAFAENIITHGLNLSRVGLLDRIKIGRAEIQVTQIGKKCHDANCAIFHETGSCLMPKNGIFARVLQGGIISPGDAIEMIPFRLDIQIITLSDRAATGLYEDRSGPAIRRALQSFFADKRWHLEIAIDVIPDDPMVLQEKIESVRDRKAAIVITTGSTGVGARDIAPRIVASLCDRLIPGLMEYIRIKYGTDNPRALLSRSMAGIAGETLVYALPGSVKAVDDYMSEILKTMEHLLLMIRQVDNH